MTLPSRRATVLDVARVAKVAASTVSRCLRGGSYVSEDVRRRITEAVRVLNYEPNYVARSLRGDRTRSIGVVFPQIANPFFSRCVQQIELEATRQGFAVILLTHQEDPGRQSKQLAVLRRSQCDGVILTAAPGTEMEKLHLEFGNMPVVGLDRPLWDGADVIMLRHLEAAAEATRHLLGHGIRQVACVTANPSVYSFHQRILGYEQAMAKAGLKSRVVAAPDYIALQSAILQTLRERPKLGALLSLSSMATVAAMKAVREIQCAGARQVAVIGFDDVDLATLVRPSITVMSQPTERMARESVELLFKRIEGGAKARPRTELKGELVCRESCGCSPAPIPASR